MAAPEIVDGSEIIGGDELDFGEENISALLGGFAGQGDEETPSLIVGLAEVGGGEVVGEGVEGEDGGGRGGGGGGEGEVDGGRVVVAVEAVVMGVVGEAEGVERGGGHRGR